MRLALGLALSGLDREKALLSDVPERRLNTVWRRERETFCADKCGCGCARGKGHSSRAAQRRKRILQNTRHLSFAANPTYVPAEHIPARNTRRFYACVP